MKSRFPCQETTRIIDDPVEWFIVEECFSKERRKSLEKIYADIKSNPENHPDVDIDNPDTIITYLRNQLQ